MMPRPSRDETLLRMAVLMGQRSTCSRRSVGAIFARQGRILSSGYNGAPAGLPHCDHLCTCTSVDIHMRVAEADVLHSAECASVKPCLASIHAEANAVAWAARCGVGLEGATLYTTDETCHPCALLLLNTGLVRVVYRIPYRNHDGTELLLRAGVDVGRLTLGDPA